MKLTERKVLELQAYKIRKTALEMIHTAGSGHIGGSFSLAEIIAVLYWKIMKINPKDPDKMDRDRLVLSKGHCSPILYAALAEKGFFPKEHLKTFRTLDSDLSGHVEIHVPGVDMSAGSLGQGLSVALGMAMYGKVNHLSNRVYAILGDGEIQEGQIWEAAMAASFFKTGNLTGIIDYNKLQLDGAVADIMNVAPVDAKFRAFGWHVEVIDGGNIEEIYEALRKTDDIQDKPVMIIADTVKGAGVSIFENQVRFHGGQPSPEEYEQAIQELEDKIASLEVE